jgi:ATP-dependent DNA ligase
VKFLQEKKEEGILPDFVKPVQVVQCKGYQLFKYFIVTLPGKGHLRQYFEEIAKKGGEGVMLRKPNSLYEAGRSENLCKYKVFSLFLRSADFLGIF